MEANQVAFDESFPSLLEANLKLMTRVPVEVINASVSGWGTDDELTYLVRYGIRFQPDVVLVAMTLHNDIQDNLAEEFHTFQRGQIQEKPRTDISSREYAILKMKEFLASHSHLYQVLLRAVRLSWTQGEANRLNSHVTALISKKANSDIERGWNMTQQLFRKIKQTSTQSGAAIAVFLIPLWIQVSEQHLQDFLNHHHLSTDQVMIDQPQYKMKLVGDAEGITVMDLLPEFHRVEKERPHTLYFAGDGHWTAAGHRLAAGIVSEQLVTSGILSLQ